MLPANLICFQQSTEINISAFQFLYLATDVHFENTFWWSNNTPLLVDFSCGLHCDLWTESIETKGETSNIVEMRGPGVGVVGLSAGGIGGNKFREN